MSFSCPKPFNKCAYHLDCLSKSLLVMSHEVLNILTTNYCRELISTTFAPCIEYKPSHYFFNMSNLLLLEGLS